ncbi:MAG TPA: DUF427 domain-containing protein [Dermatophilaceae bacterium]|nr:DUF427 domain-containing protein [Dermatophilaceae bacterium]
MWDYPRPPVLRESAARIWIILGGVVICETSHSWQVLETSHPPSYYLPRQAFLDGALAPGDGASVCEWKGSARYLDVRGGDRVAPRAAWFYPTPTAAFAALADHVAVYPEAMDECRVDGERVRAQPGGFYGGWITATVSGPFKGIPGSNGW